MGEYDEAERVLRRAVEAYLRQERQYVEAAAEELERTGALTVEGDRDALARFATLFPPPPKVSAG